MKLTELFDKQKELDKEITKNKNLEGKTFLPEKILALQVELGELANETRCFKYWSDKEPSAKNVILEEYADCLHFILSIGNDLDLDTKPMQRMNQSSGLTKLFNRLFFSVANLPFYLKGDEEKRGNIRFIYEDIIDNFFLLGEMLGFRIEEIHEAYNSKHEVNYKRLKEGY